MKKAVGTFSFLSLGVKEFCVSIFSFPLCSALEKLRKSTPRKTLPSSLK